MPELNAVERVILDEIIEERDPSHWTPHRRRIAVALARTIYGVQRAQAEIGRVGFVTTNGRGNPEVHPVVRAATQGINQICSYRRSLAIHARGLGGEARDIARRREINRDNERNAPDHADGLLARPNVIPFGKEREDD